MKKKVSFIVLILCFLASIALQFAMLAFLESTQKEEKLKLNYKFTKLKRIKPKKIEEIKDPEKELINEEVITEQINYLPKVKVPDIKPPNINLNGMIVEGGIDDSNLYLPQFGKTGLLRVQQNKLENNGLIGINRNAIEVVGIPNSFLGKYYPRLARKRGISGETELLLNIDKYGKITHIKLIAFKPSSYESFGAKGVELMNEGKKLIKYKPAIKNGKPVSTKVKKIIKWTVK